MANIIDRMRVRGIDYLLKDSTVAGQLAQLEQSLIQRIQAIVGSAPAELDTLKEIADALGNNNNAIESILQTIAEKASKDYVDQAIENIELTPGPKGDDGLQGSNGKSAYELAVDYGYEGTEEQWLASLKGETGTFDSSELENYASKQFVSTAIEAIDAYTKVQADSKFQEKGEYVSISLYNALLSRVTELENKMSQYHPEEVVENPTIYLISTSVPTEQSIRDSNFPETMPSGVQPLNIPELSKPTLCYIVYPLSWEKVENDTLISPQILDSNGWEQGAFYDEDTPTITVDNVVYRVLDIELGNDTYTIEFK